MHWFVPFAVGVCANIGHFYSGVIAGDIIKKQVREWIGNITCVADLILPTDLNWKRFRNFSAIFLLPIEADNRATGYGCVSHNQQPSMHDKNNNTWL